MESVGPLVIAWAVAISIVYARWERRDDPRCPSCEGYGRAIVEDARAHLGWALHSDRWLPNYAMRQHFHCLHCGHAWWQDA